MEKKTGLREIKQVELYEKWGPLVPAEFRSDLCANPNDAVIASVQDASKRAQNDRIRAREAKNGKRAAVSKKYAKRQPKLGVKRSRVFIYTCLCYKKSDV